MPDTSQPNWQSFIPSPQNTNGTNQSATRPASDKPSAEITSPVGASSTSTHQPVPNNRTPARDEDFGMKESVPFSVNAEKHKSMAVISGNPPSISSEADGPTSESTDLKKQPEVCKACNLPISGHFVRALNNLYHTDCFTCLDCKKPCAAKFFPLEVPVEGSEAVTTVALCEQCYFRRQDLLCYSCDDALRGSYITALGKKYHVEHFTCSLCSAVFGTEVGYYEHEDRIYCRYHYSTLYAAKCEGCKTAILKQFVEMFRGGREQQWHPECYMINKFWNVLISPDNPSVYPSEPSEDNPDGDEDMMAVDHTPSEERKKAMASPSDDSREAVLRVEQAAEEKSFHIWSILCGYEEATASCISDMLQFASSNRYHETLLATARLVAKIEILLSAIDIISAHIDPLISALIENDNNSEEEQEAESQEFKSLIEIVRNAGFTQLRKEPKTLCKKVVSFMSLLSKSREPGKGGPGPSQELLDSVTSMAHYLKLLIRHGLSNSLRYDRAFATGDILGKFLDQVATHEQTPANPLESLRVSGRANDRCLQCNSSTEDDCACLDDKLWHLDCLQCKRCGAMLGSRVRDARYQVKEKVILCTSCVGPGEELRDDFTVVTKLHQFIYLVKIALARLKLVLETYDARDRQEAAAKAKAAASLSDSRQSTSGPTKTAVPTTPPAPSSNRRPSAEPQPDARKTSSDQGYMTTLKDIRKLRSTRLSQQISQSSKRARRSRILDMPSSEQGQLGKNDSNTSLPVPSPDGSRVQRRRSSATREVEEVSPPKEAESSFTPPRVLLEEAKIAAAQGAAQRQPPQHEASPQIPVMTSSKPTSPKPTSPKPSKRPGFIKRISSQKRGRKFKIEEDPKVNPSHLGRTTDLIKNEKSLILDDIPRIVAAEQARELRPNAYRHRRREDAEDRELGEGAHLQNVKEKKEEGDEEVVERFMSELSPQEMFYVRHIAIAMIQPTVAQWMGLDELMDAIETRKQPSLWEKFGKAFSLNAGSGGQDPKNKKKTGVFGISLEQQVERYGVDSTFGVGPGTLRIPAFVDECVSAMRQMDMSVEGIFRKNGNIRRSKELADLADKNPGQSGMFTDENPIQLAALFKRYLRELPDSLLCFKLQKLWLKAQELGDDKERVQLMHLICCLVPSAHRDVMEVLFYFLYWTSSFSHIDEESGSKMDIHNLSTVITPNILYTKQKEGAGPESSEGYFLAIEAVDVLIKEHDTFAKVPRRVAEILSGLDLAALGELPSVEVLGRIQSRIEMQKANSSGGTNLTGAAVVAPAQVQVPVPHLEVPKAAATRQPPVESPTTTTTHSGGAAVAASEVGIKPVVNSPLVR